jgi:hypothetical protein
MNVDAYFIVDTVGRDLNKVVGGPYWTLAQAETKLERMRDACGDARRYRIREAFVEITFKEE